MRPTILALDLEGTLISNAVSQIPRPGLYSFLEHVQGQFDQLVMFTTVEEGLFRRIATFLVLEGQAPAWFSELAYTQWEGTTKDLTYVAPTLGQALLLDDYRAYFHPEQEPWWIEVPLFGSPYEATDTGLRVAQECNDPLNSCSGVNFPQGDADERNDGGRDQALDRPAQVGAGP
ncbi:NIF family HAD-type phosphatase [Stenotrophomonas sp.]|uniref:NIF family HAD-type phosphatase n=1 Tax=Stenotrophomonas sp. TaxID=69392 RepID=UPI002899273D|nr:NIF family HAD-type phosphatase [Stenotrophomonas sp.]